jgi:protoporphyrinogen oxidase
MKKRIAVLGAGPMGLAVAYQLSQDGYTPIIFEADDRVGGMTATFDFNGLEIERFYHFHCTSDLAYLKILKELGIDEKMKWVETKMGYWYKKELQPWGNPLALLSFRGISFISKIRYGLHAFFSTKRNNWKKLDHIEASEWIQKWIGKEAYDVLWKKLFDYKFYDYVGNLSAAWIWSRISRIGKSRYNIFKEKLGYLEGGSKTFLNAIKNDIESKGGKFFLSSPVSRVIINNNNVEGVLVNGQIEHFDLVISTIPLPFVPKLIPDLPGEILSKFKSLNNIAVVCVIAKLKKPISDKFWLNINDDNMDIPGLVEYTNLQPLKHNIVYVPFYLPGEHPKFKDSNEVFIKKVKNYLCKINPKINSEDFIDIFVSRYRYAQPICEPRFLENLPPANIPVKGLWVADTSHYYPEDRGISESIEFGRKMAREAIS